MKKIVLLVIALLVLNEKASADAGKSMQFKNPGIASCKLVKSSEGKWILGDEKEVTGQPFVAVVSPANPKFSNFKVGGIWFAALNECLVETNLPVPKAAPIARTQSSKFFTELRAQNYMMMSASGSSTTASGVTTSVGAYKTSIGFAGRFGYALNPTRILFLDVSQLSGKQTTTYTGLVTGTPVNSDSILKINAGLMVPLRFSLFGALSPYIAASLGYVKASSSLVGAVVPGGTSLELSTSAYNVCLEGGATYKLSRNFSAVGEASYTYMSFGTATVTKSDFTATPVGTKLSITQGYSHITLGLGVRYSF